MNSEDFKKFTYEKCIANDRLAVIQIIFIL